MKNQNKIKPSKNEIKKAEQPRQFLSLLTICLVAVGLLTLGFLILRQTIAPDIFANWN